MIEFFNLCKKTQPRQVLKNTRDIENLKEKIKNYYNANTSLTKESTAVNINLTDVPENVNDGLLIDKQGLLFKIVDVAEDIVYLKFYSDLTGVSIEKIENKGTSQGEGFTITHCEATLTNGQKEAFDVYAKDGNDGTIIQEIEITNVPTTATSGTLTPEQLAILQANENNVLKFNNERYLCFDPQHDAGVLIYSHVGQDTLKDYFIKCISITIATRAWSLKTLNISSQLNEKQDFFEWTKSTETLTTSTANTTIDLQGILPISNNEEFEIMLESYIENTSGDASAASSNTIYTDILGSESNKITACYETARVTNVKYSNKNVIIIPVKRYVHSSCFAVDALNLKLLGYRQIK